MPHALSSVQCSHAVHIGDINATVSFNQQVRHESMSILDRDEERCRSILHLKIHVTTSFNQLLRYDRMTNGGCDVHR
jgi:hypothetical protein